MLRRENVEIKRRVVTPEIFHSARYERQRDALTAERQRKVSDEIAKGSLEGSRSSRRHNIPRAHRTLNPERTMSVQPNHVEEVEKSWAKVAALGVENVGVLLFKNIFAVAPEALELFSFKNEPDLYNSPKLKAHGANVVSTVGKAVAGLRELEALVPVLAALGERHVGYGILEPHYDVVGKALVMTLEQGLGDAFTPEVKEAWTLVYGVVATTMKGDHYKK